jgi:hypothetical protein
MQYKNNGKFMIRAALSLVVATAVLLLGACETPKPPIADSQGLGTAMTENSASASSSAGVKKPEFEIPAPPSGQATSASSPVAKAVEPASVIKPEQLLADGKDLYDKGDYKSAIRKLGAARDAADDSSATKQNSLKLLAFSYCVTNQKPLCKQQFTSLLKLAPAFQLSRGEAGHPLWGPVFKEAKDQKDIKTDGKADNKVAIQVKPTK